jgi:hypothetical protein
VRRRGIIEAERETIAAIVRFKQTYVSNQLGLAVVAHPKRQEVLEGSLGINRGSTVKLGRRHGDGYYEGLDVWESIDAIQGDTEFNRDYVTTVFAVGILGIGVKCKKGKYFDQTPELEFLRHVRNGFAHGNRFDIRKPEPRRPARFKEFEIIRALNGQEVLWEYLWPGNIFDLLDHVEAHLRERVADG